MAGGCGDGGVGAMSAAAKYDILTVVDVPEHYRGRWQKTLGILASLLKVKAALVMRVHAHEIEVFARDDGEGNVYEEREQAPLDSGLYCETVMSERAELMVPNALADHEWDHNPDIKVGMVSYLGLPLEWPTGNIFGTICVLDNRPHEYTRLNRATLQQFRDLVQDELALIFENHLLRQEVAEREDTERELRETQSHLQSLARRLQVGREQERALLARGLHDEIIQNLTAVMMDLDSCSRRLPEAVRPVVEPSIAAVDARVMATIERVREMCDNLIPAVLEDLGLAAAIDWAVADFKRRTGASCDVRTSDDTLRISPDAQRLLFRIFQQVLSHVAPGFPSPKLIVELAQHRRAVVLRIAAEGHPASDPEAVVQERIGLGEMEAEVVSWGGKLRTWRTPDDLAFLEVSMPIRADVTSP
jgi:signal transduction histidine kinase